MIKNMVNQFLKLPELRFSIPPTTWAPPVHVAMGGHGFIH